MQVDIGTMLEGTYAEYIVVAVCEDRYQARRMYLSRYAKLVKMGTMLVISTVDDAASFYMNIGSMLREPTNIMRSQQLH